MGRLEEHTSESEMTKARGDRPSTVENNESVDGHSAIQPKRKCDVVKQLLAACLLPAMTHSRSLTASKSNFFPVLNPYSVSPECFSMKSHKAWPSSTTQWL